jgi:hypothetical protein
VVPRERRQAQPPSVLSKRKTIRRLATVRLIARNTCYFGERTLSLAGDAVSEV